MAWLTDEQRIEYDKRNRRLLAAVRAGVPYPMIAERFKLTRPRVSQIAISAGLYRRQPRKAHQCDTKNP